MGENRVGLRVVCALSSRCGWSRSLLAAASVLAVFCLASAPSAPTRAVSSSAVPDATVVARVGGHSIALGELQRRYALLSSTQRQGFESRGGPRAFLEEVLVSEQLYRAHAEKQERAQSARNVSLASALEAFERRRVEQAGVQAKRVAQYLEEHRRFFESPESIHVWRIQLRTRQRAQQLLTELTQSGTGRWKSMCREHSTDAATSMRAGNLGFVFPNGHTNHPEVRVSPQLFQAAARVKDGQLVPEPVAEGSSFAVVWRKASRPATRVARARETASALLIEESVVARLQQLRSELRAQWASKLEPARLGLLQSWFAARADEVETKRQAPRPLQSLRFRRPRVTERGLR